MFKWNYDFIWQAYELAQEGATDTVIANHCGTEKQHFSKCKKKYPALRNALRAARKNKTKSGKAQQMEMLQHYVHGRLPEDLKGAWKEMMGADNDNAFLPAKRLDALLGNYTDIKKAKQTLWLYAWFKHNFNQSEACRQVDVKRVTVENIWKKDPDFFNLFNEMNNIKGDFFEGALVKGVRDGNPYLIGFANKTFNRNRGYGETLDVNVNGHITHSHVVKIEDLSLPLQVRKELLKAVRAQQKIEEDNPIHELTNVNTR